MLEQMGDTPGKVLGVTSLDLFVPVLTFVFGEAQLNGTAALVSTFRLNETFYGFPPNEALLEERLIKEAVHELGHTFGLIHCRDFACVMHSSTSVEEIDVKGKEFCGSCRKILRERE
jgi:archaemetzincin